MMQVTCSKWGNDKTRNKRERARDTQEKEVASLQSKSSRLKERQVGNFSKRIGDRFAEPKKMSRSLIFENEI